MISFLAFKHLLLFLFLNMHVCLCIVCAWVQVAMEARKDPLDWELLWLWVSQCGCGRCPSHRASLQPLCVLPSARLPLTWFQHLKRRLVCVARCLCRPSLMVAGLLVFPTFCGLTLILLSHFLGIWRARSWNAFVLRRLRFASAEGRALSQQNERIHITTPSFPDGPWWTAAPAWGRSSFHPSS